MYRATKIIEFCAGHRLDLPYESKCSNQHGHNYTATVTIAARQLNECGMVCDFTLVSGVVKRFDHQQVEGVVIDVGSGRTFADAYRNPTAELIAEALFLMVMVAIKDEDNPKGNTEAYVERVEIAETGGNIAEWSVG